MKDTTMSEHQRRMLTDRDYRRRHLFAPISIERYGSTGMVGAGGFGGPGYDVHDTYRRPVGRRRFIPGLPASGTGAQ